MANRIPLRSRVRRSTTATATTLNDFAPAVAAGQGLAEIVGARREIEPVQPGLALDDGVAWLVTPEGVDYPL